MRYETINALFSKVRPNRAVLFSLIGLSLRLVHPISLGQLKKDLDGYSESSPLGHL